MIYSTSLQKQQIDEPTVSSLQAKASSVSKASSSLLDNQATLPMRNGQGATWRKLIFLLLVIVGFDKFAPTTAEEQYLLKTLTGHTRPVYSVAWSPDGTQLASGGGDWAIHLWDVTTGQDLRELAEHTSRVNSVAWSPNGEQLASGSGDGSIHIWNPRTGQNIRNLNHTSDSVAWSPDGTNIASGSTFGNGIILVFDTNTGEISQMLGRGEDEDVYSVAWSPDGERLASGGGESAVHIWDIATGLLMLNLTDSNAGSVYSVAWSPDGMTLATAHYDGKVRVWNTETGRLLQTASGHIGSVYTVAWSPSGMQLASGGQDRTLRIWNASSGEEVRTLIGHGSWIRSVTWSPDGTQVASGSDDTTVRIWAASSPPPTTEAPSTDPTPQPPGQATPTPNAPTEASSIAVTIEGIKLTFVGIDELDGSDLYWFESVTTTWCEEYFSTEKRAITGVRELRTTIRVINQNVIYPTSSPGTSTTSNTLVYEQAFEYYLADENAPIDAEDLVTAPFIAPLNNQLYLSRLAKKGTGFESIDSQMRTIPQLPDKPIQKQDSSSSGGSTGAIVGAVVGVLLGVLLAGTLAYRWKTYGKSKQHEPDPRLSQTRESESHGESEIQSGADSPGSSPEVSHSSDRAWAYQTGLASVPEVNDSNIEMVDESSEYVLQNKDQCRSVEEYAVAEVVPMP